MKKILTVLATTALLITGATVAHAGGSDDPTPYIVDQSGITLPEGDTFPAHGHINLRLTDGKTPGIHFDPNNGQPSGEWIGKSHMPWSELGIDPGECVAWIQISLYNEHYGEGGQEPLCLDVPRDTTEPTPEPTPTPGPEVKHGAASSQSDFCDSPLNGTRIFLTTVTTWTEVEGETIWSDPVTTIDTVTDPTCDYEHPEPEPEADVATTECLPTEGRNARGECVTPTFTG